MSIRSLASLYACYPADTPDGKIAREAIVQSDWLYNSVEFDPVSGDALPQSLSHFLTRLLAPHKSDDTLHDRLWRIVDYSADAFVRIIRSLNEQPRTDHARMHVSKVREMDASSFVKLANRTGRTVREKLGNDPFVTSVRHYQSVDILENRLLKAFALRMEELLESRAKAFDEPDSDLLIDIRNWLISEEAKNISRWENLPPNNALLSHRDYRRIWKAWRWLQSLDDDVQYDAEHVSEHRQIISFWDQLAQAFAKGNVLADIPIDFDYDVFYIGTKTTDGVVYAKNAACHQIEIGNATQIPAGTNAKAKVEKYEVDVPVCIDLTSLKPMWTSGRTLKRLDAMLVWQQWVIDGIGSVPLALEDAVCVWTNENATTVTIRDLMVPGRVENNICERAASDFLDILKGRFHSSELVWLVPDCVNEFELSILRRHINNRYELAQPLPRSIATVVEKVDGRKLRDGYSVTILDAIGGRVYATKLVARKCPDPNLIKRVPQSFGYYWERQPTVVFTDQEWTLEERLTGINILDEDLQWKLARKDGWVENPQKLKRQFLESDERFAGSDVVFTDIDPVAGGLLMYEWQKSAGDIPLWRDHLPDLDLSASTGEEMLRVHLVSNTTIVPRTGLTFEIPVEAMFTLPAGRDVYTFPLFQGAGVARLRYQARLSSREAFPLKEDLPCKLVMRYRYGADNPYELRFQPRSTRPGLPQSFLVEWVPVTAEMFEANAPVPKFPIPLDWTAMSSFGKRHVDMLARLRIGLDRLLQYAAFLSSAPTTRRFVNLRHFLDWRDGNQGGAYSFLRMGNTDVYVHSDDFEEFNRDATEISFDIETDSRGRSRARNITLGETIPSKFTWMRFLVRSPMSVVFGVLRDRDGLQSLGDLYPLLDRAIEAAETFYEMDGVDSETKYELLCVMAYYNSRIPQSGINYLTQVVEGSGYNAWQTFNANRKAIALAIGECSEDWQLYIIHQVLSKLTVDEKWTSVIYEILSIALWRSESLIHKFDQASLIAIIDGLAPAIKRDRIRIENLAGQQNRLKDDHRLDAALNTLCKHLELLLALLRTRESGDQDIRRAIMPGANRAVVFESIVGDEVIPLFKKGLWFESRISLGVQKPDIYKNSPDLLYALKLGLTGDDGANSIIVSGGVEDC